MTWLRLVTLVMALLCPSVGLSAVTADPDATAATKSLLDYFYSLMSKTSGHVLTGQTIWRDMVVGSGPYMWSLLNDTIAATGKRPAIYAPISTSYNDAQARQAIMDHWNAGGLIKLSIFLGNEPEKAGWYGHAPLTNAELDQLMVDPRYLQLMDDFAANVLQYQSQGVVFIARLFPEANGNWNWYSVPDQARFVQLWKQFQARMRTKGVHNLIYLFCPADEVGNYLYGYPGDAAVDLTGLDSYQSLTTTLPTIAGYTTVQPKHKPMIIGEYGFFRLDSPITYQHRDAKWIVPGLKASMPDIVGIVNWTTPYNITSMNTPTDYMLDPYVVNAPVPWNGAPPPADATPPSRVIGVQVSGVTNTSATVTHAGAIDNVGIFSYRYEICTEVSCADFGLWTTSTESQLSTTLPDLTANTTYHLRVNAQDAAGNPGPYSSTVNFTTTSVTTQTGGTPASDDFTNVDQDQPSLGDT
ncbi:MAG: hypothetical protein NTNFB02_29750 [Nitrospira sp.]